MRRFIFYCAFLLFSILLAILYNGYVTGLFLVAVVFYPVTAWLVLMLHRIFLKQEGEEEPLRELAMGEEAAFFCKFSHHAPFPVWNGQLTAKVKNVFSGEESLQTKSLVIAPFSSEEISFSVQAKHYGLYQTEQEVLSLKDLFRLVQTQIRIPGRPVFLCTPFASGRVNKNTLSDLAERLAERRSQEGRSLSMQGEETPDVAEVRDFQPGDRKNRLHPRLSAKLDRPIVKVLEREEEPGIFLLPENSSKELSDKDACLEWLCDTGRFFIENQEAFSVLLPVENGQGGQNSEIRICPVRGEEEFRELFLTLLTGTRLLKEREADRFLKNNPQFFMGSCQILRINQKGVFWEEREGGGI